MIREPVQSRADEIINQILPSVALSSATAVASYHSVPLAQKR